MTVIAGSTVSSRLAADAARAQVAAAAAQQARADAQAAAQAQAQASAQAAQDQVARIAQDQSTLDSDLATLASDTATVQQGTTLASNVQTMTNDLATEQSDRQQGICQGDARRPGQLIKCAGLVLSLEPEISRIVPAVPLAGPESGPGGQSWGGHARKAAMPSGH